MSALTVQGSLRQCVLEMGMSGFLGRQQIREITGGKADSTVWRWENSGNFPKRRQIGPNSVGWLESEVEDWIKTRPISPPKQPHGETA